MKKVLSINLTIIFLAAMFTGCSKNTFHSRKNHQPRVKVEANNNLKFEEAGIVSNKLTVQNISVHTDPTIPQNQPVVKVKKEKETLIEKMAGIFVPKKKEILRPVFQPQKKTFGTAKTSDDRVAGLIINLLALVFAITALLMIIGMAHGNVWVYFVVAMVFACAAIIMGFVGRFIAFRGIGLLAGILGILAIMTILIFLLLITVVHIVF